jgi:hypothetical protein
VQIWVVLILSHLVYADAVSALPWRQTVIPLRCRCPCWWICCLGLAAGQRSRSNRSFKQVGSLACCVRVHVWGCMSPKWRFRAPNSLLPICLANGRDVPHQLRGSARLSRPSACVADLGPTAEAPSIQTSQGDQSGTSQNSSVANGSHLIHF